MPARTRSAVLSAARIVVEFSSWLDQEFSLPPVEIPTLGRRMAPELAAEHLRARWGLGGGYPIPNTIHLLEAHGVAVFSLPPEYSDVDAFSFWWRSKPFVILNTMKSAERGRFDAAHELAHLVMHGEEQLSTDTKALEQEANLFASAFLIPRDSAIKVFPRQPTTDQIIRMKHKWRVAALALAYRLHDLDILSDWSYRRAVIELGRLGYRTAEPDGIERETSQILHKALHSLRGSHISFSGISRRLSVLPEELNSYLFGLAVTPVAGGTARTTNGRGRSNLRLVQSV